MEIAPADKRGDQALYPLGAGRQLDHRLGQLFKLDSGGLEESFDHATGKKIGEAHWANGKLNGELRKWDVQGNLHWST